MYLASINLSALHNWLLCPALYRETISLSTPIYFLTQTPYSEKMTLQHQPHQLTPQQIQERIRQADYMAKYDFRAFVKRAFHVLDEGTPLEWNWHLDYLCWWATRSVALYLPQECLDIAHITKEDHTRRLLINIPPRSMKSVIFSVCLKAWLLGHRPAFRSMGASYSAALAKGFNRDILRIVQCEWYQRIFPDVQMKKTSEPEMETTKGGKLIATSTGGTATGRGGNLLTADDLLDPDQADSNADRIFSNKWMTGTYYSRTNDKKNASIVVIQQRLHEDDTTGTLEQKTAHLPDDHPQKWVKVKVPSIFDEDKTFHYYGKSHSVKEGDILHPARQDKLDLEAELATMGDIKFAGQYLQEPSPTDGGVLSPDQLSLYRPEDLPEPPEDGGVYRVFQSWDTAIKTMAHNDFSVCTTWLQVDSNYYLLDLFQAKLEYSDLKTQVHLQAQLHSPAAIVIEDKASGQQLLQDLLAEGKLPVFGVKPTVDKVTRAMGIAPLLQAGRIFIKSHPEHRHLPPREEKWYKNMANEMAKFPNSRHDDIVDSVSQAINWARDAVMAIPRAREL